jgi:hypothetical protein
MGKQTSRMPRKLKLVARFANSGAVLVFLFVAIGILARGNVGGALFFLAVTALLAFNLYLIEKSATLLSEEEWLKGEVRKALLRRKLARLEKDDDVVAVDAGGESVRRKALTED